MPAILVHGVPDTHRVWDGVRRHLTRSDVEAWDLPGFGAPRPAGFGSTKEEYVDRLIERLERIGEPVDLVGHDWGCILTARIASLRPDLVRTWAGGNGPISAEYVWHPAAKVWQDQVEGDRFMAELKAEPFAAGMVAGFDVPEGLAEETAGRVDGPMKDSILRLYRSAVTMGAEWEPALAQVSAPSLVFWGASDPACPIEFGRELGASLRARKVAELDCNHWTVLQKPAEVAALLEAHWSAT
ncbi:oxidoreductase [Streptomyces lincolnensis]|uniref:Oxidoreductase n=1 Tax=Streptomyces lincolnensis TaxID=1915 RepID=A0A1B1MMB8_STRLN|nr:alpha/beta hydrolase [Streptomyces lincolnensis]ANS69760.1 oxidoreductase [Streptomyces lincolnensis]AXG58679.1 oxidoreductase [Streptomyces lincolnensis]QMV11305.1 alpha/beta fold hydrolase [Streptomyces lincolnensis]